jgi:diguanylate cyclase (GGDEF)-like protein
VSADVERFRNLLRLSPCGCLLVAGTGEILAANDEAVETLGIPLGRLLDVPLGDLLAADHAPVWTELLAGAGESLSRAPVRLARALALVELAVRSVIDGIVVVAVRDMATEERYSALAGAELTHDPVTGFPNRYHLLSQLHDRLTAPHTGPLALIGIWIDELPQLASSRGEHAVRRVVQEVGQRIQRRLRAPDLLGRLDQAGFLGVLRSDAPVGQLTEIAERLRAEVSFPVDFDNALVSFTASVAIGSVSGRQASIERALAQLEAAANRAASGGGNRTEILEL